MLIGLMAVGVVSAGPSARADFITFDADGGGPSPALNNIGTFVYGAGNALAKGALPLTVGGTFQLYFQARLNSVQDINNNTIVPAGLNTSYEITIVGSITEVVTSVSGGPPASATFALAPVQSLNSFVRIFQDPGQNSNPLTGMGFNDGTMILTATPNPGVANSGNFSFADPQPSPPGDFDQHGANDYPGVSSVSGSGASAFVANVTGQNNAFFLTPLLSLNIAPIGNATPFTLVDPSALFAGLGPGGTDVIPFIGTLNGGTPAQGGGTDFQFQSIAQNGFLTVPEPASLALTGLGFISLLGARARRTRKQPA
jgi:hypothetical protein